MGVALRGSVGNVLRHLVHHIIAFLGIIFLAWTFAGDNRGTTVFVYVPSWLCHYAHSETFEESEKFWGKGGGRNRA